MLWSQQVLIFRAQVFAKMSCSTRLPNALRVTRPTLPLEKKTRMLMRLLTDFAVIYLCDIDEVPDFNQMYELYDTMTMMFFYRNKHMMCDFGTGNNNKLNWVLEDKQELIDIIETIYKGAKKGRGLVVSPKGTISPTLRAMILQRLTACRLLHEIPVLEKAVLKKACLGERWHWMCFSHGCLPYYDIYDRHRWK